MDPSNQIKTTIKYNNLTKRVCLQKPFIIVRRVISYIMESKNAIGKEELSIDN